MTSKVRQPPVFPLVPSHYSPEGEAFMYAFPLRALAMPQWGCFTNHWGAKKSVVCLLAHILVHATVVPFSEISLIGVVPIPLRFVGVVCCAFCSVRYNLMKVLICLNSFSMAVTVISSSP